MGWGAWGRLGVGLDSESMCMPLLRFETGGGGRGGDFETISGRKTARRQADRSAVGRPLSGRQTAQR